MAEPQIDAVVFDIGNVLLDWDARRVYRPLGMSDDEIAAFFERVDFDAWNLEQDRGRPFAEGVEALAKQFPDDRALIERITPTGSILFQVRSMARSESFSAWWTRTCLFTRSRISPPRSFQGSASALRFSTSSA